MQSSANYKLKYNELKARYMNDIDVSFRLGFEQGQQAAQQQQMQQAQEQQAMAAQQMGQGEQDPNAPTEEVPGQGSELDQHISQLESMIGSGNPDQGEVQKSVKAISDLRKAEKFALEMKKSDAAISEIAKALHTPAFKMSVQATHNMPEDSKKAVTLQHKIVNDIFKSWESETKQIPAEVQAILDAAGHTQE